MGMLDLRRQDLRTNVLTNSFWMSSGIITPAADDAEAVLFSFPLNARYNIFVPTAICVETIQAFAGGTLGLTVGTGSIATDDATDGDTVAVVDADYYFTTAAIAGIASRGVAFTTAGAFVTALAAGTHGDNALTCLNADLPVIYAALTSDAVITAGQARVHVFGSYVPVTV